VNRRITATAITLAAIALLAGCTADPLAEEYANGSNQNYVSGDGSTTEVIPENRDEPVEFSGTSETGQTISSEDFAGSPYVVNFWFAGCAPCQLEAPDLKELSEQYSSSGVSFVGVNTWDGPDVAKTFAEKFQIAYPSILDANSASVQLAFSGSVGPNATPTTLVMDGEGRVAGRISGLIRDPAILSAMIDKVLAEAE
jgi:thiol-disulfide isomerase/thioredoxin